MPRNDAPVTANLKAVVARQVAKVLTRGEKLERFDQLRSRHFWSTYLFAPGAGNPIPVGQYDIFQATPSMTGQGYPTNVPLSTRETNWLNGGRVPDNQNLVITEIGVSLHRPPAVDTDDGGAPLNAPPDGIWANLPAATQALVAQNRQTHPDDATRILDGIILEMKYLTNAVPLGPCSYFSQSAGLVQNEPQVTNPPLAPAIIGQGGDPTNGIPAAQFRRKLEVPILLQGGETMGMRLNIHRAINTLTIDEGGTGWFEVRTDWWAHESFVEKS